LVNEISQKYKNFNGKNVSNPKWNFISVLYFFLRPLQTRYENNTLSSLKKIQVNYLFYFSVILNRWKTACKLTHHILPKWIRRFTPHPLYTLHFSLVPSGPTDETLFSLKIYQLRWNIILTIPCTHFGKCFAQGAFCLWHFTTKGTGKEHLSNIKAVCRSLPFPSGHPIVYLYLLFYVKTDTAIILRTEKENTMDVAQNIGYSGIP